MNNPWTLNYEFAPGRPYTLGAGDAGTQAGAASSIKNLGIYLGAAAGLTALAWFFFGRKRR